MSIKLDREQALRGVDALNAAVGAVAGMLNVSMGEAQASLFNGLVVDILEKIGEEKLRAGIDEIIGFYNRNKLAGEALKKGADGVIIT